MNDATRYLEIISAHVGMLPQEQRTEVAKLLQQIQALIRTASDVTVASATVTLFCAIADAARIKTMNQPDTKETH